MAVNLNFVRRSVKGTELTAEDHDTNLDKIEAGVPAVTNTLTSTSSVNALAAGQGKILKDSLDATSATVTSLSGSVSSLSGTVSTQGSTLSALSTTVSSQGSAISGLTTDVTDIEARLLKLQHANCIYVSENGHDTNNTGTIDSPLRTVRAAALAALPGDVVFIAPGTYVEPVLPIRWKYDVTVFGSGLRSTIIQPAAGQEFNDIFKVDSGFWCWGISFAGHQADATQQAWAVSFDELADNSARGAIGLGAFVLKSPYIQNCTSITAEDDGGLAGSQSTGNTGGGIKVDGSKCAINSPIRSMVVDSYTQVNLGGPGCLVLNDGYAQLVSFFGTFCTYHVRTETGGQVNLSGGGTTDFGTYGLMADGYSPSPLYTGAARIAAYGAARLEKVVTIDTSTDVFSCVNHGLSQADQITFSVTQGSLPTNLTSGTTYFVIASGLTADAFKVSATLNGTSIDMSGAATGAYQFIRQGATEVDVISFSPNRLGRQIKYPTAGSAGSPGNPVSISARGGSTAGSTFTVTLGTSTIGHEYVGGGTVTVGGSSYPITSATYNKTNGLTVLTATGYAPVIGAQVTLSGLSFICDSSSRPNAGQLMFPQLIFPRNATTELPEAKTFAYTRTGNYTLTYQEAAAASGPVHEYVSGGTATIGGTDYGVANAVYNKDTGVVTLTTKIILPAGNGNVIVNGLVFICPTSAYIVTSSVPINNSGSPVPNSDPTRAGYRVLFYSGLNGGLKDPITVGQKLDFRNRSQVSAPSHTFEFVGSGLNYDALPWNGGVPVPANGIVETNNGRVYSSNTNEKGDFAVGSQFTVDGTTGTVTINTDQFNLSGLNFIGPFSRNGGISTVGEQLREVSNNTALIASTGAADGNTAPTQFAVRTYSDNKFLQDVTVTAGLPLTVTDTSSQDGQGYWMRRRNLSISVNVANGLARLDGGGLIPAALLPSYVDDVIEVANLTALQAATGETGKIYVTLDNNKTYRWSGSAYIEVSPSPGSTDSLAEGSVNLYFTQARARQSISVSGSTGLAYNSGTGIFTFNLPNTTVSAGSYSYASITVDAQGRITSASSGTPPGGGTITSVTGTAPIVSSGGTTPVISINEASSIGAGSMSAADKEKLDSIFVNRAELTVVPVRNNSGATIAKGTPVIITGSTGVKVTIAPADASDETTAANTLGLTYSEIVSGFDGLVVSEGQLTGLNTAALTEGQLIYLSETTGQITSTRPTQPAHGVILGWCVKQGAGTSGILYVKVDNGLELDELHDVLIAGPTTGQVLRRASDGLWKNAMLTPADAGLGTTATPQFAGLGLGTAAVLGWELTVNGGNCSVRSTVTASSNTYTLDVQAANEFVTAAAINGATTINLSNLANIPSGYVWRGVLTFSYTSGTITWFSGNTGYTVKWDGGTAMTPTAGEVETVVITVVGSSSTIEIAPLKGRA